MRQASAGRLGKRRLYALLANPHVAVDLRDGPIRRDRQRDIGRADSSRRADRRTLGRTERVVGHDFDVQSAVRLDRQRRCEDAAVLSQLRPRPPIRQPPVAHTSRIAVPRLVPGSMPARTPTPLFPDVIHGWNDRSTAFRRMAR